ncbi:MAG: SAM-dependent methyltransferase, partial [Gammaproteobacteria bacterium]|nr:SAM-dependent methyltransferase [Gammaproteobacteria bacterium]
LEAYTPRQLDFKTGGPPVAEMTMTAGSLISELQGLDFIELNEQDREVHEGQYHHGMGAVVQLIARKL